MTTKRKNVLQKISRAKDEIGIAERELKDAVAALPASVRAEKIRIGKVLEDAFSKLRAARTKVRELEVLLSGEDE